MGSGRQMARTINKFTAKAVEAISEPGRHSDGGGLYLKVLPNGRRQWVFMYRWDGRQKELGLGPFLPVEQVKGLSYKFVSLADARKKAVSAREAIARGDDPMAARKADQEIPTFGKLADELIDDWASGFRNEKHVAQWKMTLGDTYCAALRSKPVNAISTEDVLSVLQKIWQTKQETASRIRGRIERVLDAAKVKGLRSGENPARWRGHLDKLLPRRKKLARGHHTAMPYADVPAFVERLRKSEGTAARALELLILTAARTGEAVGATWDEFDLTAGLWTVKPERMKAGKEHRVPLSDRALEIVKELHANKVSNSVFPGAKKDKALSNMAMAMQMRRMEVGQFTVHGFRSAFRDYCGEETHWPRETAEAALAHVIGNAVEQAYRRGDALAKRKALMQDWADYVSGGGAGDKVVKLSDRRAR